MQQIIEDSLYFYNYNKKCIQNNIWEELSEGLWQDLNIDAYLYNDSLLSTNLEKSKQLFPFIQQIIPGTIWNPRTNTLDLDTYSPNKTSECSFNDFIDISANYFESLHAKKIGVHLSGGLDSSLIICLLHKLNIPFVPIGLCSNTFEFRTERKIQELLIEWGVDGLLLNIEEYPYYSELDSIPKHQIPDADIKSVAGARALANAFKDRDVDVVLSGQGGDSLLTEPVNFIHQIRFNIKDEFINYSENDRIYKPLGLKLESFFANKNIIDLITTARLGQQDDTLKIWMRHWAKDILPKELSEFSYCADFFGLTVQGLNDAKPIIKELLEEAFYYTNKPEFSPKSIKRFMLNDILSFHYKEYIHFCSMISIASWYHSLLGNKQ